MNLREAQQELGLTNRSIYAAVERGEVHAFKLGGTGRIYYPEWELRELRDRLAVSKCYWPADSGVAA